MASKRRKRLTAASLTLAISIYVVADPQLRQIALVALEFLLKF